MKTVFIVLTLFFSCSIFSQQVGNGGFRTTNGNELLRRASGELTAGFINCTHHDFYSVELGIEKEKLIQILTYKNIIKEPFLDKSNINLESNKNEHLHFTYDMQKDVIVALKSYFDDFKTTPIDDQPTINTIKRKLLHEASHLFRYDEKGARLFTSKVLEHLIGDWLKNKRKSKVETNGSTDERMKDCKTIEKDCNGDSSCGPVLTWYDPNLRQCWASFDRSKTTISDAANTCYNKYHFRLPFLVEMKSARLHAKPTYDNSISFKTFVDSYRFFWLSVWGEASDYDANLNHYYSHPDIYLLHALCVKP